MIPVLLVVLCGADDRGFCRLPCPCASFDWQTTKNDGLPYSPSTPI